MGMKPNLDLELLTRIAAQYYLEDKSQAAIAERFGLSRIKVGRLLKRAQELGIVEIKIHPPTLLSIDLETKLMSRFGLKAVMLALDQETEEAQRRVVAPIAAGYLARQVRDGATVAIGMGRNVAAVASAISQMPPHDCTFVSAIGGSPEAARMLNSGDICHRLAELFAGRSEILYAPAYAENADVRRSIVQHEDVRRTLNLAASADVALVGIGDAQQDSAVVQIGCFATPEMNAMRQAGAVGDILGYFFDIHGNGLVPGMRERVIGLSLEQMQRIPFVIGVASENSKALALLGALRTGILNVLVTTISNAQSLLAQDEQAPSRDKVLA